MGSPLAGRPLNADQPYYFPSSPRHPFAAQHSANNRDANNNNTGIFKLQYQHNFSTQRLSPRVRVQLLLRLYRDGADERRALLRDSLVGRLQYRRAQLRRKCLPSPTKSTRTTCCPFKARTRPRKTITSTATRLRSPTAGGRITFSPSWIRNYLKDGLCYNVSGATPGTAHCCRRRATRYAYDRDVRIALPNRSVDDRAAELQRNGARAAGYSTRSRRATRRPGIPLRCRHRYRTLPAAPGPCEYVPVENGAWGGLQQVGSRFFAASLTDNWRPNDRRTSTWACDWIPTAISPRRHQRHAGARVLVLGIQHGHVREPRAELRISDG